MSKIKAESSVTAVLRDGHLHPVACASCGWDAGGRLMAYDSYAAYCPPGPRGIFDWTEAFVGDPEDRVGVCAECDEELNAETLRLREA